MIDILYKLKGKNGVKPKTYRKILAKVFLNYSEKKRKSKAEHRKMNRKLIEALNRNINQINKMLDNFAIFPCTSIPRGKAAAQVEFGLKLAVSLDNGFASVNTFS